MPLQINAAHWPPSLPHFEIIWPTVTHPAMPRGFTHRDDWLVFVDVLSLHPAIPMPTATKYSRAQKLFAYAWLDFDFLKAGELMALAALEGALRDCYGRAIQEARQTAAKPSKKQSKKQAKASANLMTKSEKPPMLGQLLRWMVQHDGLSDRTFAFAQRYQTNVVGSLARLADIRNDLAHADTFEGWPWSGLLEMVKDLIEYAYRARIAEDPLGDRGRLIYSGH